MATKKGGTETQYDNVPDGGWGWVVVTCSFFVLFMFDGIFASFGLLLPILMESLNASPSLTSFGGSLMIGSLLFVALLTSFLVERFGCRKVAITGAFIASLGLLLSSFSNNIWMFLVTYGVLAGCGMGLLYLPTVIIVNKYFDKKRGISQSIMASGSGIGVMVISPLVEVLLDVYNWRGCLIILAGLFLQLCVACALYRLPNVLNVQNKIPDTSLLDKTEGTTENSNLLYPEIKIIVDENDVEKQIYTSKKNDLHENGNNFFWKYPNFKSSTRSLPRSMFIANLHDKQRPSNFCSSHCISENQKNLVKSNSTRTDSKSLLSQKDIFYCGSLKQIKHLRSQSEIPSPRQGVRKLSLISIENSENGISSETDSSVHSCKGSWLANKYFWVVAASAFLTQMAQFIPINFLGDLGISLGLDSKDIAWIFSVFGVTNTLGRLLPGFIIDKTRITANTIYTIGMIGCAISCFSFPACKDYPSLMTVTSVFGFFIAFPIPLQPLMILDSVGMDNLTKGLGCITVLKGPAAITGPPIAGALYEWAKNYDITNIFAGCLCLGTAVILVILPVYQYTSRFCNRKDEYDECDISDS